MNIQRMKNLRDNLLDQLDYELDESSRLFIMASEDLRKRIGWNEEKDVVLKKKENSIRIVFLCDELLKIL